MLLLLLPEAALSLWFDFSTLGFHGGDERVLYLAIFMIAYMFASIAAILWTFFCKHPGPMFRWTLLIWILSEIALSLDAGYELIQEEQMLYALGYLSFIRAGYFVVLLDVAGTWHWKMTMAERAAKESAQPTAANVN